MTALVILTSGAYNQDNYTDYYLTKNSEISEAVSEARTLVNEADNDVDSIIAAADKAMGDYIVTCDIDEGDAVVLYQPSSDLESIISTATDRIKKNYPNELNASKTELAKIEAKHREIIDKEVAVPNGVPLTSAAFSTKFGHLGGKFVSIAIMMFAFSTILGWSFYGSRAVEYLFGLKAVIVYKIIFIGVIIVGCVSSLELVWDVSDTFNGLMAIPNLLAITLLSGKVITMIKDYLSGKEFVPEEEKEKIEE